MKYCKKCLTTSLRPNASFNAVIETSIILSSGCLVVMFCKNIPGAFRTRNTNKSLFDVIFINSYPTPDTNGINGRWNNSLIDKEIVPKKYITMVSTKANTKSCASRYHSI